MSILDKAISFAVQAHEEQYRKNEELPFIMHPIEVAAIASTMTSDLDTLSAAMLHDVIEDTQISEEIMEEIFGRDILYLVLTETENKYRNEPAEDTWKRRKEESLNVLRNSTDRRVKILWVSDKLSNMRAFCRQFKRVGDAFWQDFNMKDKSQQCWYYTEVLKATQELEQYHAWQELKELIEFVFGGETGNE